MNKSNLKRLFDPGDTVMSVSGVLYLHSDTYLRECGSKLSHIRYIVEKVDGSGRLEMDAAGFRRMYNAASWTMPYTAWFDLQRRFQRSYEHIYKAEA